MKSEDIPKMKVVSEERTIPDAISNLIELSFRMKETRHLLVKSIREKDSFVSDVDRINLVTTNSQTLLDMIQDTLEILTDIDRKRIDKEINETMEVKP